MDPRGLWDFDDPAGSEVRFRQAADSATGAGRHLWMTQVARALGLQARYREAHELLDGLPTNGSAELHVRVSLERGRLLRSSGDAVQARLHFERAASLAEREALEELHVDALHMVALVVPTEDQLAAHHHALATARAAHDPRARAWQASVLNNIGMCHSDAQDWGAALAAFEDALDLRQEEGSPGEVRVARWMVAWALRHLGSVEAALEIQQGLRHELDAAGESDPFVDEEIALLTGGAP